LPSLQKQQNRVETAQKKRKETEKNKKKQQQQRARTAGEKRNLHNT
jgi:hypothetical protein